MVIVVDDHLHRAAAVPERHSTRRVGVSQGVGHGLLDERYYRDVRVTTLYEGTSQIQKLIIGRAETGLDALTPG